MRSTMPRAAEKGLNFHDMRGELERVYPYAQMREDALAMAAA
jgi:fatty-acyl-CoA synthase